MSGQVQVNDQDGWIEKDNLLGDSMTLTGINLANSTVTPIGMEHFDGLTHLKFADFSGSTQLEDASLSFIKSPVLEHLNLKGVPITDKAVPRLSQFKSLKFLDVSSTKMTSQGIAALESSLPGCTIVK